MKKLTNINQKSKTWPNFFLVGTPRETMIENKPFRYWFCLNGKSD